MMPIFDVLQAAADRVGMDNVSIFVNGLSALCALFIMQSVTYDAGFATGMQRFRLVQRITFALLSIVLATNAAATIATDSEPRVIDLVLQIVLALSLILTCARNMIGPASARR